MNKAKELRMKWITGRTNIISDMLNNPDEHEIYPTSKCFTALDDLHNDLLDEYAQQVSRENATQFCAWFESTSHKHKGRTWIDIYDDWKDNHQNQQ